MSDTKMEWLRADSTVYTLMHHGWRKGEEVFRNRVWFNVNVDRESGLDRNEVAAFIVRAVNAHDQLVAALRALDECYCEVGQPMTSTDRLRHRKAVIAAREALKAAEA